MGRSTCGASRPVWTSEFGRTPFNNSASNAGREHHSWAFSSWLAGAGVKRGYVHGATDDYGIRVVDGRCPFTIFTPRRTDA